MHSDVLVVGGGPAGLAAAIAARAKGFSVSLVDSRKPPIDKPCGEGLLPEAAASLRALGVDLESCANYRFTGIRFSDSASSASARFGRASAYGVRRTVLHRLLVDRAQSVGVDLHWGARLVHHDSVAADIDGQRIFFRWLIAADGMNSPIRKSAGLNPIARTRGRFAFRRHFSVAPWTDLVEVHWGSASTAPSRNFPAWRAASRGRVPPPPNQARGPRFQKRASLPAVTSLSSATLPVPLTASPVRA